MKLFLAYYWEDSTYDWSDCEQGEIGIFSTKILALEACQGYCNKRSAGKTHFKSAVREFTLDVSEQ